METDLWRTATIFISSTFRDMMEERDIINSMVLPRLNETFQPLRIMVRLIDMRWGINTESVDEYEREKHILKVCLDEIDRSRPFFIGLLGYRYGWIPPETAGSLRCDRDILKNRSVTEIEIQYGALRSDNDLKRSVFCIRDFTDSIPEDLKHEYMEDSPLRQNEQNKLRERVEKALVDSGYKDNLLRYNSLWRNGRLTPEYDFADRLYDLLADRIKTEFNITEHAENRPLQLHQMMALRMMNLQYNTIDRKSIINQLDIQAGKTIRIDGKPQCGKSVLLAQLATFLGQQKNLVPIYYDVLLEAECTSPRIMLNFFGQKISEALDLKWSDVSSDFSESKMIYGTKIRLDGSLVILENNIKELCFKCREKGFLPIFIIDSIDQLSEDRYSRNLLFSNEACCVVFTAGEDSSVSSDSIFFLDEFCKDEAERHIQTYFSDVAKEIHQDVRRSMLQRVLTTDSRYNPGRLSLLLYWIKNLDAEDFMTIGSMKGSGEENIRDYMLNLIESLPDDYASIFRMMSASSGRIFGKSFVEKSLQTLVFSPNGIQERELEVALGDDWNALRFAEFRRVMSPFISYSQATHYWKLSSKSLISSLSESFDDTAVSFHKKMSLHLWEIDSNDHIRQLNLPYHAIRAMEYEMCSHLLANPDSTTSESFNMALCSYPKASLLEIARQILNSSEKSEISAVSVFLVINILMRQDCLSKSDILDFACSIISQIEPCESDMDEYQLTCLSYLWSELSLMARHDGSLEQYSMISETLLLVGRLKFRLYPTNDSKQSLYKGCMALASFHMDNGNFEKSMEYYNLIAELSKN